MMAPLLFRADNTQQSKHTSGSLRHRMANPTLTAPRPTMAVLVVMTTAANLAMNIILPSLPAIQKTFATDYATVQLTLTLFLVVSV